MTLHIDFETTSDVDIRRRGAYVYFESPHTRPLMASYIIDGEIRRWRPPDPCPDDIRAHVESGGTITAHNAQFERLLWQMILTPRYGWPEAKTEQFVCTAATAAALSLPRNLFGLGSALDLPVQKDKRGAALIKKFSMPYTPRAPRKSRKDKS
jgi:DNA polymerase